MSKNLDEVLKEAKRIAHDDTHGYSQVNRLGPDYDCSSFLAHCLLTGGFNISKYSTTRNLYDQLVKENWKEVVDGSIQPGDIWLTPGKHVAMSVDSDNIVHARSDENKGIEGKQTGDQTGNEIEISKRYTPSYGWKYHLRYIPLNEKTDSEYELAALYITAGIWSLTSAALYGFDKERVKQEVKAIPCSSLVLQGAYGDNPERKKKLEEQGFDYNIVQKYVNIRLGKGYIDG